MPILDPQVRDCLTIAPEADAEKFLLTAPVRWIDENDEGEMTALGVGSIDGKPRQEKVATLHSLLTRMATHQSQKALQNKDPLGSRPTTSKDQPPAPAVTNPPTAAATEPSTSVSEPVSHTSSAPSVSGENTNGQPTHPLPNGEMANLKLTEEKVEPSSANGNVATGAPTEGKLDIPAPTSIEKVKTEYATPPSDPEVNRQLQGA